MRDDGHFGYFGGIKHLGFRVSARESTDHDPVIDDFEVRASAVDCARLLHGKGWVDVRLCAIQEEECFNGHDEVEIDWRAP